MPPPQSGKLGLLSFVSGLLWGVSSGIGLMVWVLVKLLNFQRKEVRRAYALATGSLLANVILNSTQDLTTKSIVFLGPTHPINTAVDLPS